MELLSILLLKAYNRKYSVFLFNLSSHYHIYIVKCLFSSRDD